MVDIKELIQHRGPIGKFECVAPEGFSLVHEDTLELLKDMSVWIEWRMGRLTIEEINNFNLKKELS